VSALGESLSAFWRDSRVVRWAALAGGVVVLLGLAGLGFWKWQDVREQRASQALAEATQRLATPGTSPEAAARGLEAVMAQYPGSRAAAEAAYRLGNLHYAAGRWGPARGAFEIAAATAPPGALRALAALGSGFAWEAESQWPRAEAVFQALAKDPSAAFLKAEALAALARVQEQAGNRAAAIVTWERLRKEHPDSRPAGEIEARIANLQGPAPKKP
jgi:TolA-binding protein